MVLIPTFLENFESDNPPQHVEGQLSEHVERVNSLLLKVSDDDLLQEIKQNLEDADPTTNSLRNSQQVGRAYYLGDQFKNWPWPLDHPIMENRIWMSWASLLPMITANAGDPDVRALLDLPGNEKITQNYLDTITATLLYDYNVDLELKKTIRKIITHWYQCRIGVGKFRLDPMTNKRVFEDIDPRNVFVPTKDSAKGWVAEYRENTIAELIVMFPNAKARLLERYGAASQQLSSEIMGTRLGYYEYWRDTFCAYKLDDMILEKKLNPLWDWKGIKKITGQNQVADAAGNLINQPIVDTYKMNIMQRPKHPYIFFNYFNADGLDFDETGYIDQARTQQDALNHRKQQIVQKADDSGILVASGDAISEDEFSKYDPYISAGTTFWMPTGNPSSAFYRLPPGEVSNGMLEDLNDTRQTLDNILGTQPITRGQFVTGMPKSAIAQQLAKSGDANRIAPLAEAVEDFLQKIYLYDLQMHMMFTDEDYAVPVPNVSSTADYQNLVFNRNKVPFVKVERTLTIDGVENKEQYMTPIPISLIVRKASTLEKDPADEYNRNLSLIQANLIDPLSFFEDMGVADPVSRLERIIKYNTNPLMLLPADAQEDYIKDQHDLAQMQATVMPQPPIGSPMGAPGTPPMPGMPQPSMSAVQGATVPSPANDPLTNAAATAAGGATRVPTKPQAPGQPSMAPNSAAHTPRLKKKS